MFTGLIEEIGTIKSISNTGTALNIEIAARKIMSDLKPDDSVAINGVCQTATSVSGDTFKVTAVEETVRKTAFSDLRPGEEVNLERALRLGDRLGGHIVQGHVDTVGKIVSIVPETAGVLITAEYPAEFARYAALHGSITVSGVSLTIARCSAGRFTVSVIPHTFEMTTLKKLKSGSKVNLEFDVLGRYVENLLKYGNTETRGKSVWDEFGG